ncbi:FAR1-related sequence 5-like protein [Tanacetum coccineum]
MIIMTKMFVVKAATNKIGATCAHNLYCSMKGGYEYVHGTTDDFKNHQRDVNQFMVFESDATMLMNKNGKTGKKSESENLFFKSFTSPGATLVSFMMSYESAMERQRYRQESLDFKTIDAAPKCITQLDIELHAARVYTRTMFSIVQTKINEGFCNCTIQGLNKDEGCETVIIKDKKPNENKSLFHKKRKKREKNKRSKLEQWEKQRKIISTDVAIKLPCTFKPGCMRTPRPTLYEQNETPGGSIYWEPHVEGIPIPVEGTYYDTIDEALDMYTKYAEMAGFEVKKGGQRLTKSGAVQHKYLMCNKEGVPKGINIDTLDPEYNKQKRNTTTHVTGCKARIRLVLDIVSAKYKLVEFKPKHNHMLIPKEYKHFTKKQRKMNQSEKMFVVKAATNKIGATRAHNLYCSMKGGYEYVHGTTDDFKNHQRDVNQFIGESDAQMLINKMENRKKYVPNFTFQYKVENSELVAMFWADEVAKCNYKEFGDIVSFDATFNSNKYNMKFVPFIGIDNHGKCVTLGSGMLLHEDTQSYTWLLTAFMTAFLKEPTMIVTDQDRAMKRAIEAVFKKAKHKLLIHIEIRISLESQMIHVKSQVIRIESHAISLESHICKEIYNETDFKERFDKIVWNMFIEPLEFEEKWAQLIEDFDLKKHKWLKKMFNLREIWIPAYFIDSPLYGLKRTTSMSES